jgi:hypothetical protein
MESVRTRNRIDLSHLARPRSWLAFAIALGLAALPIGCGPDESSGVGGDASSADFASLRADAESARDAAVAAGADTVAPEIFAKGTEYLDKAITLEADPEATSKTKAQYQRAREKFVESVEAAGTRKGKLDELSIQIAAFEKLREEVKVAGGDQVDPATFAKAEQNLADARVASAAGDVPKAKREINYGIEDLKIVQRQTAQAVQQKKLADDERALCEAEKAKALAIEAEKLAAQDWQWASDQERDGAAAYESKQFERAVALFRQAKGSYLTAATYAQQQKDTAARAEAEAEAAAAAKAVARDDIPKVGEIEVPDPVEDALDLVDLPSLFKGAATYKESTLAIDWADGTELREDVQILLGKSENVRFEGEENVGAGEGVYKNLYVMAGNTTGFVLIDAVFEDGVSVKATVKFQMVAPKGYFEFVMMSEDPQNYYASEFASNVKLVDDGNSYVKAKSTDPVHAKPYNTWVSLTKPYELEVKFHKPSEDEPGEVRCYMNGTETCRYPTDKFRRGRVGFHWSNTKFIIKELSLRGLPQEEWAMKALEAHRAQGGTEEKDKDYGF